MKPIKLIARDSGMGLSYDAMKEARKLKSELKRLTTDDSAYYSVLARYEVGHFDPQHICPVALEKGLEPSVYAEQIKKSLQMEINAVAWSLPTLGLVVEDGSSPEPAKAKKGKSKLHMKFNSEEAYEEVREHLRLLGVPEFYDQTIRSFGYAKASDIPTHDAGVPVYKALCVERNRIQLERETIGKASKVVGPEKAKDLMKVLRDAHDTLGAGTFFETLDKYGCPTIDIAIGSYDLAKILTELLEISEKRKKGIF